uniref:Ubiquitin-like domain-containing protein n=1 Tax=Davidia involucrata TaxID=16924 RepID=A0A5B7BFA4_DAVIN
MESREEEEINLYLKVIKTIALNVKRSETIKNLKVVLREKEGISENIQELFFTGERLRDDHKLVDYGIEKNSTLHLVLQNSVAMKLFVNIPSNHKTIEVEVKTHDTIQNIKSLIQAKEGIQSDQYTLISAGKLLEDNRTLAGLKIQGGATLHLVFNPRDVLSVSVKMPTGEIVKPEVKVLYTIRDVKTIVGSLVGFPVSDQDLFYAGKQLEDWKTLAYYNIKEESILEMLLSTFQIFIKNCSGKTVTLDVCQQDTVKDVKNKIFHKSGTPVNVQSLVFAGKSLQDGRDLASYNIWKHCTLHMVFSPSTLVHHMKLSDIGNPETGLPNSTTIHNLKAMIQKKMEKPVKEVFLRGQPLQDNRSLADYAIEKHTEMVVALEVR